MNTWDLIVSVLYFRGSCNRILSADALARVWEQGDGYGRMSLAELSGLELVGDWSHIRDSSHEGQERIAKQIRSELSKMDRERKQRFPGLAQQPNHHHRVVKEVVGKLGTTVAI